jgi:nanoRNase/pAp phosphatase (c-di-AMP/oligoRNAs hydrolase)
MDEKGVRSNGYLVTAWAGERADACCIIHGYADGSIETPNRPALSASFYANSFLKNGQGRYDLSRLATAMDPTGGGHANACGCRIQEPGVNENLETWLKMWANRDKELAIK